MSWDAKGIELSPALLGKLDPTEVLIYINGPKLYLTKQCGMPLLVYESFEDDQSKVARLLVTATSNAIIDQLTSGVRSIYCALDQPWLFAVDQRYDGEIVRVKLLCGGLASVPIRNRPERDVLLCPRASGSGNPDACVSSVPSLPDCTRSPFGVEMGSYDPVY